MPRVFERYWYHAPGLHGSGNAAPLDCPVLMDRDADGDGVFERRRGYLQDRRGSVIGVREVDVTNAAHTDWDWERITYTGWGLPLDSSRGYDADYNNDGNTDQDDVAALISVVGGGSCLGCDDPDLNRDGNADQDDIALLIDRVGGGWADYRNIQDNRFLYRGYWWDPYLHVYHVRHRVYDPNLHRWLQPDPAGYVDGPGLYAYCNGDPVNGVDPTGLVDEDFPGENIRAGSREYDAGARRLARSADIGITSYLSAMGHMLDPRTYSSWRMNKKHNLEYRSDGEMIREMSEGVGDLAAHLYYFNDLQEDDKAALFGSVAAGVHVGLAGGLYAEAEAAAASNIAGDGVVYRRTDPRTGEQYVGSSKNWSRYLERQAEHDRILGVSHKFDELELGVQPGFALRMKEGDWIRRLGGPSSRGGTLANKRYEVSDGVYCAAGGQVPRPTR